MKKRILYILALGIFTISFTSAQTIIPGDYVSGIWTAAGSPYLVQGSITIHADSMLTIEPGVDVKFQGNYSLTVNGLLEAVGTETDSIHFLPADTYSFWGGIRFSNAPDSSHMVYCTVSHVGQMFFELCGIICTNSNPVIRHCRISDNTARSSSYTYAAGITLNNSNPEIAWCNIINNVGGNYAGGIYLINSSPVITGCNISGNAVFQYGGGIYILGNSNPMITNCNIENNTSNMYGGGIAVLGGAVTISECTVGYNHAETGGGGISIHGGSVFLDHCIIERNNCLYTAANGKGGGIFTNGGVLTVDHCTFYGNEISIDNPYGMEIHTEGNAAMTVTNSIFLSYWPFWTIVFNSTVPASVSYNDFWCGWGSGTYRFMGNVPPGLGVLTQVNANGDSCDVFYNIYLDPLFANPANRDYHLTWANWPTPDSTKSPCIDAGDPLSPFDPDGTIADMGAFYFNQLYPVISISDTTLDFGIINIGQSLDLPLTIRNNGTGTLQLQNIFNQHSEFTHNWDPADSLILSGDSLTFAVTFAPVDTNLIADTLWIENNAEPIQVQLTGKGKIVVGIEHQSELPKVYALYAAYPNPFNPSTTIEFDLPRPSFVILKVYNLLGEEVDILISKQMTSGKYKYIWNANNLASGIYFYRLNAGEFNKVRKIILVR